MIVNFEILADCSVLRNVMYFYFVYMVNINERLFLRLTEANGTYYNTMLILLL